MHQIPVGSLVQAEGFEEFGVMRLRQVQPNGTFVVEDFVTRESRILSPQQVHVLRMPLIPGAPIRVPIADLPAEIQDRLRKTDARSRFLEARIVDADPPTVKDVRSLDVEVEDQRLRFKETQIIPAAPHLRSPLSYFETMRWHEPKHYFARLAMHRAIANWYEHSDGVPTLLGARVHPMAHQLYAARRVLQDHTARSILADEVGLGKTIEAGLILQGLLADDSSLNVLIIVPGAMARQWLCEAYLRFGARVFTLLDGARWSKSSASKREQILNSDRLIVSSGALMADANLRNSLLDLPWDVVVVDEAHRYSCTHSLYPFLQRLSRECSGFLALSATPSKRETEGLLALLGLVAPDAYGKLGPSELEQRLAMKQDVWDKLSFSVQMMREADLMGAPLPPEALMQLSEEWRGLLPKDPLALEFCDRMDAGDAGALEEVVAYVQEFHRVDHRLIRTRRSTLTSLGTQFSTRIGEALRYRASTDEVLMMAHLGRLDDLDLTDPSQKALRAFWHLSASVSPDQLLAWLELRDSALRERTTESVPADLLAALTSDPGPAEEEELIQTLLKQALPLPREQTWLREAIGLAREWQASSKNGYARHKAALDWISKHLEENPTHKVLVFAQHRCDVEAFAKVATKRLPTDAVGVFHHGLDEEELVSVTQRFQRRPTCRVLVSDELGGEGRNFQMASAIVHLDQPWMLGRLEQRVGRLDRLGRDPAMPVRSIVLIGPAQIESALMTLHGEVVGTYQRSLGGLEFILPELQQGIWTSLGEGIDAFQALMPALAERVARELTQADVDFDLAMDAAKPELEHARQIAHLAEGLDADTVARDVRRWAKSLGINAQKPRDGVVSYRWSPENLVVPLEGYPSLDQTLHATFDRHVALEDESLQFLGPGHRLIDALTKALQECGVGRATVMGRDLGSDHVNRLFAVAAIRCGLDRAAWLAQGLPQRLLGRAERRLWPAIIQVPLQIRLGRDPVASLVEDPELRARLLEDYRKGGDYPFQPGEIFQMLPGAYLWPALQGAMQTALEMVEADRQPMREQAERLVAADLRNEMGYLRGQAKGRTAVARAAAQELEARHRLRYAIRMEQYSVEALALVVGVKYA